MFNNMAQWFSYKPCNIDNFVCSIRDDNLFVLSPKTDDERLHCIQYAYLVL